MISMTSMIIYIVLGFFLAGFFDEEVGTLGFFIFIFLWPIPVAITIAEAIYKTGVNFRKALKVKIGREE